MKLNCTLFLFISLSLFKLLIKLRQKMFSSLSIDKYQEQQQHKTNNLHHQCQDFNFFHLRYGYEWRYWLFFFWYEWNVTIININQNKEVPLLNSKDDDDDDDAVLCIRSFLGCVLSNFSALCMLNDWSSRVLAPLIKCL